MDRRRFLLTSLAGAVAVPRAAEAQLAGRIWRIGHLSLVSGKLEQYRPWLAAFRDGLRELGYVEGENVIIEQRYAAGQIERLPTLAAELVRLKVDILVAAPAGSALAAKRVTSTVPIVFMGEPDPVGTGLVAGLARPGGNATGLADAHADLDEPGFLSLRGTPEKNGRLQLTGTGIGARQQYRGKPYDAEFDGVFESDHYPMRTTRLTEMFGLRRPIVLAPMANGATSGHLAAAVSAAGGLGLFGGIHSGGSEWVREQLRFLAQSCCGGRWQHLRAVCD